MASALNLGQTGTGFPQNRPPVRGEQNCRGLESIQPRPQAGPAAVRVNRGRPTL